MFLQCESRTKTQLRTSACLQVCGLLIRACLEHHRLELMYLKAISTSLVIVQFNAYGWDFEIFCQPIPTNSQWGVRHFRIEQRLLALSPDLRPAVSALKRSGMKTEPAFAETLGLPGDPYVAILGLEQTDETELLAIATAR